METNWVVAGVREKYPDAYGDLNDLELARAIGEKFPAYRDDAGFEEVYQRGVKFEEARERTRQAESAAARERWKVRGYKLAEAVGDVLPTPANLARGVEAVGQVARGAAVDVMSGNVMPKPGRIIPNLENTGAAWAQVEGRAEGPLPGEERLTAVQKGLADAAQMAPEVAGMVMATAAGVPAPLAIGGVMGGMELARGGDVGQAAVAAGTGAVLPGVSAAGREVAARGLARAIEAGLLSGQRQMVAKGVETLASQGAMQVLMEGINVPRYLEMSPEERKVAVTRSIAANVALLGLDVPELMSGRPAWAAGLVDRPRAAARVAGRMFQALVEDPMAVEAITAAADEVVLERMRTGPASPEGLRRGAPASEAGSGVVTVEPGLASPLGAPPGQARGDGGDVLGVELPARAGSAGVEGPALDPGLTGKGAVEEITVPPETITGRDEGEASGMPAEGGVIPPPGATAPPAAKARRGPTKADRPFDILDAIEGLGMKIRGKRSAKEGAKGYYDEDYKTLMRLGATRKLFTNSESGQGLDDVADALRRDGYLGDDASVGDLKEAMIRAATARKGDKAALSREARVIDEQAKEREDFEGLAFQNKRRGKGAKAEAEESAVVVNELLEGDEFTLAGTKVNVKELVFDEETADLAYVVLEDGKRFGVQTVGPDQVIYPDGGSVKKTEPAVEWPGAEGEGAPADPFSLEVIGEEQLKAELAAREEKARQDAAKAEVARRAAAPLTGDSSDVGQGALFATGEDLFSGDSAESRARGAGQQVAALADMSPGGGSGRGGGSRRRGGGVRALSDGGSGGGGGGVSGPEVRPRPAGGMEHVRPVEMPELVKLVRAWMGGKSPTLRRLPVARGNFVPDPRNPKINLRPDLFKTPEQAATTLAHEIGHLVDWLPDQAMDRGNLLGRIGALRNFLKATFPRNPRDPMSGILLPKDRARIRRAAEKVVGERHERGAPTELAAWQGEVSRVYAEKIEEEIERRGLAKVGDVTSELRSLSQWWRGWDPATLSPSKLAYFESSVELYADALSVLLNAPEVLQQRAPVFYEMFFAYLGKKPEVKRVFWEVQELLGRGPEAVAKDREGRLRAGFMTGKEILAEKLRERRLKRDTAAGMWRSVKSWLVDRGEVLTEAVAKAREQGVVMDATVDAREAWEQWLLQDNRTYLDLDALGKDVVGPVEEAGYDLEDLGTLLKLQREMGDIRAYRNLQEMRVNLGPEKMAVLERAWMEWQAAQRAGSDIGRMTREMAVAEALESVGLEVPDMMRMAEYRAKQGTRAELANPGGFAPLTAEDTLQALRVTWGAEKSAVLEGAARKVRELIYERVKEGVEAGIYSKETFDGVITANKDWYAAFRGLDHVETYVSPLVRKAYGTLGDIENPFYTTVLKLMGLNRMIMHQRVKRATRELMGRVDPEAFSLAETYWRDGRQEVRAPKAGLERVLIWEDGKAIAYDTDPYIAKALAHTPGELNGALKVLDVPFRKVIYPLIITYNPAFQFFSNPLRDLKRTHRNLGAVAGVSLREYLGRLPGAARSAWGYVAGRPDAAAKELMRDFAIGTPLDSLSQLHRNDPWSEWMIRYRMGTEADRSRLKSAVLWLPRQIERVGMTLEAMPKLASYRTLVADKGMAPGEAARVVRNAVGTPNYRVKGEVGQAANAIIPFINIFMQGYRADARIATSPKTAGGWWARWALTEGSVSAWQGFAAAGLLGAALEEWYAGVGEHDKENYTVIPLGSVDGGDFGRRVAMVRIPRDETARLLGALTYKAAKAAGQMAAGRPVDRDLPFEAFAAGADIVPTLNPVIQIGQAWVDYASGRNPVDAWRDREVVPDREWMAGGVDALKPMLSWTVGKTGVANFFRYDQNAQTFTEVVVGGAPLVNRAVKITDYGYRERQRKLEEAEEAVKARARLQYGDVTRSLMTEYYRLQRIGEHRTTAQEERYFSLRIWHGAFGGLDESMIRATEAGNTGAAGRIREQMNGISEGFRKDAASGRR